MLLQSAISILVILVYNHNCARDKHQLIAQKSICKIILANMFAGKIVSPRKVCKLHVCETHYTNSYWHITDSMLLKYKNYMMFYACWYHVTSTSFTAIKV